MVGSRYHSTAHQGNDCYKAIGSCKAVVGILLQVRVVFKVVPPANQRGM
jgi:hypothetical protein